MKKDTKKKHRDSDPRPRGAKWPDDSYATKRSRSSRRSGTKARGA